MIKKFTFIIISIFIMITNIVFSENKPIDNENNKITVSNNGNVIRIKSNFDSSKDIILEVGTEKNSRNAVFNFFKTYLVNKDFDNNNLLNESIVGELIHTTHDNIAPIWIFEEAVGANHGYLAFSIDNTDKTDDDIGSLWTDGTNDYLLSKIEDGKLVFMYPYTERNGIISVDKKKPISNLRHKSDGKNTSEIHINSSKILDVQIYPSINKHRINIKLDNKILDKNGIYIGETLTVEENYNIINYKSIYQNIILTGSSNTNNLKGVININNIYNFTAGGTVVLNNSIEVLEKTKIAKVSSEQNMRLTTRNKEKVMQYIPNSKPISGYDFSNMTDITQNKKRINFTNKDLENKSYPINRQVQWIYDDSMNKKIGMTSGYIIDKDDGDNLKRLNNNTTYWSISSAGKNYGILNNSAGIFEPGTKFSCTTYKSYLSPDNVGNRTNLNKIHVGNDLYLVVDYHGNGNKKDNIHIDENFNNKKITILEKTNSINLNSNKVENNSIDLNINGKGYLIAKISDQMADIEDDKIANIEDLELLKQVNTALGKVNTNSKVTKEELLNLTTLSAPNKGIKSLSGLEDAKNLKYINLNNNSISDLSPLSNLDQLTHLYLRDNNISDLSHLSRINKLEELYLRNNKISSSELDYIKDMNHLKVLDLDNNIISDIKPICNLVNLERLNLKRNEISTIPNEFLNLTKLNILTINSQKISLNEKNIVNNNIETANPVSVFNKPININTISNSGIYDSASNTIKWNDITSNITANYNFNEEIDFGSIKSVFSGNVSQPMIYNGYKPVINGVDNIRVKKGSYFYPLDGVSAYDAENGDLTSNISVKGNVDTNKVGEYELIYSVADLDGNTATIKRTVTVTALSTEEGTVTSTRTEELVGEDRFETSIKISNKWSQADNVVLSNANSIIDSLSSTPLAYAKKAPILLSNKDKLNDITKKELIRLKTKNVYLIGGTDVLDKSIETELSYMGINIIRIGGLDRFETSLNIAQELDKIKDVSKIALVNGYDGLSDATSINPIAAKMNMPIILSNSKGEIPQGKDFIKSESIQQSYIIGGTNVVPINSEKDLSDFTNKKPVERIAGLDRNETNLNIINKFYTLKKLDNLFVTKNGINKEDELVDSLAIGTLAAKENSPILLVGSSLIDSQRDMVSKKKFKKVTRVGGNGNENAFNEIKAITKEK